MTTLGTMTTVLTYGNVRPLPHRPLNLIDRLSDFGDRVVIAVSADEFNTGKGANPLSSSTRIAPESSTASRASIW